VWHEAGGGWVLWGFESSPLVVWVMEARRISSAVGCATGIAPMGHESRWAQRGSRGERSPVFACTSMVCPSPTARR
jgi:hypothetical protein